MTKFVASVTREVIWITVGYAVVWFLMTFGRMMLGMVRAAFSR